MSPILIDCFRKPDQGPPSRAVRNESDVHAGVHLICPDESAFYSSPVGEIDDQDRVGYSLSKSRVESPVHHNPGVDDAPSVALGHPDLLAAAKWTSWQGAHPAPAARITFADHEVALLERVPPRSVVDVWDWNGHIVAHDALANTSAEPSMSAPDVTTQVVGEDSR
jgi:hypothetical protein